MSATADDKKTDKAKITKALEDYVLSWYLGDAGKIESALDKKLRKIGWSKSSKTDFRGPHHMNFEQAKDFAPKWYKTTKIGKDGHLKIKIFEIVDKVATAKVEAYWGFDYVHLAKNEDGSWKIYNVIWQSWPDGKNKE